MHVVHDLDADRWRDFVDDNPHSNIFHTPEMFQVFAHTRGYRPSLWAVVDNSGRVLALLPSSQITILGGPLRLLTTRTVAYGSILYAPGDAGREALALLLQHYTRRMRSDVLLTELRNLSDMSDAQSVLRRNGFVYEEHLNFLIRLDRPQAELWRNIRSNARRNIQKAQREDVSIIEVEEGCEIAAIYHLLQLVYRRIQVPLPDQSLFEAAFEILRPHGMLRILKAQVNGVDVGALLLLVYKGVIYYWYTGTLREYSAYRAGDLLVWHALEFGSRNGCHLFDFGGGGRPDEEYGVRDFKAKFGGDLVSFGRNTCVHAPLRLKLSTAGFRLIRQFL
jgi:CelD/BcsL family acetyltransferase involved in cellulose biosynthesis